MSVSLDSPLIVPVKPALRVFLLVLLPHLSAIALVILFVFLSSTPLNPSIWISSITVVLLVVFSFVYYSRLHLWQNLEKSVIEIQQDSAKNWTVISRQQGLKQVELLNSSFISGFIVILNFKGLQKKTYTVLIAPDSLPDQDFRRLRVKIRVG